MSTGKQGKSGLGIEAQRDRDRLPLRQHAAQVVYMTGPLDIFRRMLGRLVSSGIQYLGQVNVRAVNLIGRVKSLVRLVLTKECLNRPEQLGPGRWADSVRRD
jgi:hypothetical protein